MGQTTGDTRTVLPGEGAPAGFLTGREDGVRGQARGLRGPGHGEAELKTGALRHRPPPGAPRGPGAKGGLLGSPSLKAPSQVGRNAHRKLLRQMRRRVASRRLCTGGEPGFRFIEASSQGSRRQSKHETARGLIRD